MSSNNIIVRTTSNDNSKSGYGRYIWMFFIAFPFVMQGFKIEEMSSQKEAIILPIEAQLSINNRAIQLEVARTKTAISRGLTYREKIPDNQGMLYQDNFTINSFFTGKGNKIVTELLFLDNNKIVDIQTVQPCNEDKCLEYRSNQKYQQVVEIKAGISNLLDMKVDSRVDIKYLPKNGI